MLQKKGVIAGRDIIASSARGIQRHLLRHHPTSPTRPLPESDSYACLFPRFVDAPGVDATRESQQWPGVAVRSRVGN